MLLSAKYIVSSTVKIQRQHELPMLRLARLSPLGSAMPRGLGILDDSKSVEPHWSFKAFNFFPSCYLSRSLQIGLSCIHHIPQTTMFEFPRIKEIRTFIIDGVGSGGDYHNVQEPSIPLIADDDREKY